MSDTPRGMKICVVGPKRSGKTTMCNFLSQQAKQMKPTPEYAATAGCRILEFDHEDGQPVELWDCSGDQQYGACWPAMQKDADGVLLVYNPNEPSDEHDLALWHEWFVRNIKMDDRQCMVFAHRPSAVGRPANLPDSLRDVNVVESDYAAHSTVSKGFARFLSQVRPFWRDRVSGGGRGGGK